MALAAKGGKAVPLLLLLLLLYYIEYGVVLISSNSVQGPQELETERMALYRFFTNTLKKTELHWSLSTPTCSWKGVDCDGTNRVKYLRLPAQSFIGHIPDNTIGLLTKLQKLSLRSNKLNGNIPPDFSNLVLLRSLNLGSNDFSGKFPSVITQLKRLNNIDISGNRFYGNIPCELQDLPLLNTLRLENNKFTGNLPGLHILKSVNFSVAYNNITGAVPTTLMHLGEEAFLGNPLLCGTPLSRCTYDTNQSYLSIRSYCPSQPAIPNPPVSTFAMSGGGFLFLLLFLIILLFPVRRKQRPPSPTTLQTNLNNTQSTSMGSDKQASEMFIFPDNNNPRISTGPIPSWAKGLDMASLMSGSVVMEPPLAKGNIGASYKVELALTDKVVVVKNLLDPEAVASDERDFAKKMDFLGKMKSHDNVMPLRGYCIYKEAYLLIYDFFPTGSLYHRLHEESTAVVLEWESRKRIALGAARGLTHLHTVVNLVHGNIKSSNILLRLQENTPLVDSSCVADFGLTATPPTSYYGPPETRRTPSESGDVYAFGVLLLELLTGKSPDVIKLPEWVQASRENIWDSKMVNNNSSTEESEMVCLLQIAKQCTHEVAGERPTMEKVARMIENLNVNVKCRDHEIDELAAGPTDHEDPSHHEIYEESLAHPGTTPPPPPPAYTP